MLTQYTHSDHKVHIQRNKCTLKHSSHCSSTHATRDDTHTQDRTQLGHPQDKGTKKGASIALEEDSGNKRYRYASMICGGPC